MFNQDKNSQTGLSDIFCRTNCLSLEQLIGYAEDRISPLERHSVEKHLIDCELCSEALDGVIASADKVKIHEAVDSLGKEIHARLSRSAIRRHNWKAYYSLAAVLIIGIATVFYAFLRKPAHEALFHQYFQPYPNTIPLVRSQARIGNLELAMMEYEAENYQASLNILQEIIREEPENITACFYAGIVNLCLNDPRPAITRFQKILNEEKNDFMDHARWYLGLSYLKNKDKEQAKSIFRDIATTDGLYTNRSKELLNTLYGKRGE